MDLGTRPKGPESLYCPLYQKRCDKVCHTCMFWRPLEVSMNAQDRGKTEWDCALCWPIMTGAIMNAKLSGLGQAYEGLRNQFGSFHASMLKLVAGIAGVRGLIRDTEQGPLIEVEDAQVQRDNQP